MCHWLRQCYGGSTGKTSATYSNVTDHASPLDRRFALVGDGGIGRHWARDRTGACTAGVERANSRTACRASWRRLPIKSVHQAGAPKRSLATSPMRRFGGRRSIARTAAFGGLDILVNNAGRGAMGRFADASPDRLREVFELNFFAAAELIRESLPLLQSRQPADRRQHRLDPRPPRHAAQQRVLRQQVRTPRLDRVAAARAGAARHRYAVGQPRHDRVGVLRERNESIRKAAVARAQGRIRRSRRARATVRAIRLGKQEIIPSARGRLLVWLNRLAPRLVDRMMQQVRLGDYSHSIAPAV